MSICFYTLFETPIGMSGMLWEEDGLVRIQLPESTDAITLEKLTSPPCNSKMKPASNPSLPRFVNEAITQIGQHLKGIPQDYSSIPIAFRGMSPFLKQVCTVVKMIPWGQTRSYKDIAMQLNQPASSRAVGQALSKNPLPLLIPCHRVLSSCAQKHDGRIDARRLGGFSAFGGVDLKKQLLEMEGLAWFEKKSPTLFHGYKRLVFDMKQAETHLRSVDPVLGHLIENMGPCGLKTVPNPNVFLALAEAIVSQQLSGKAAQTIWMRVNHLFAHAPLTPQRILLAHPDQLRSAGLSKNKSLALMDLAKNAYDGLLPSSAAIQRLHDEEIITRLTSIRGIGRWTVEMMLIFQLGRPDILPANDYGIRKGFKIAFNLSALPTPKEITQHGASWKPYRTVASWYLWRANEHDPDKP